MENGKSTSPFTGQFVTFSGTKCSCFSVGCGFSCCPAADSSCPIFVSESTFSVVFCGVFFSVGSTIDEVCEISVGISSFPGFCVEYTAANPMAPATRHAAAAICCFFIGHYLHHLNCSDDSMSCLHGFIHAFSILRHQLYLIIAQTVRGLEPHHAHLQELREPLCSAVSAPWSVPYHRNC